MAVSDARALDRLPTTMTISPPGADFPTTLPSKLELQPGDLDQVDTALSAFKDTVPLASGHGTRSAPIGVGPL
jgi:hypothetical protein